MIPPPIRVVVPEIARALAWYAQVLEFTVAREEEDLAEILLGGHAIPVLLEKGTLETPPKTPVVELRVDDVQALVERFVAAGAVRATSDRLLGSGYAQVRDPFGQLWALAGARST